MILAALNLICALTCFLSGLYIGRVREADRLRDKALRLLHSYREVAIEQGGSVEIDIASITNIWRDLK